MIHFAWVEGEWIVTGRRSGQGALFYEVRLGKRIPRGHLIRRIDAMLDPSLMHEALAPHYAK